ncbi:hypothetical protein IV203_003818 [Nitzschia inconspicua]|uniref:Uncharacterized protein n=1 Tax=Nitzschia inconspicua TaxID=303405 RepID=A0A9K3PP31_9STRA|nr:hypothetical protein IV203_003818 [Nitzschia inconspicua]
MNPSTNTSSTTNSVKLRLLGFCGVDESIEPDQLSAFSSQYPWAEWGVLFRQDKEGRPRYPRKEWVEKLANEKTKHCPGGTTMNLAAHLCGIRANEVLRGDVGFVQQLQRWGFGRLQINATAINGVDTSRLAEAVPHLLEVIQKFPSLEFIIQKNDETEPLWQGLLDDETASPRGSLPHNVSMLLDESKGTGVLPVSWPPPPSQYRIGYAGGLGPETIVQTLPQIIEAASNHPDSNIWIDMESRLRSTSTDGDDYFDLDKCHQVNAAVCQAGLVQTTSI